MNVVDSLLPVRIYVCIVRSLAFPTFYWFLTFIIFNIITVIICKFFICDSRVLLWVTFWITSLKFFVRKIAWVIMPKIPIRCEIFLPWFKIIIRPFCFPIWLLSDKSTQLESIRISLIQVDLEQIKYIIQPTFLDQMEMQSNR